MERKRVKLNKDRDKAFLGAVIGGVANVIGGVISGNKQKKAQEQAFAEQQKEQVRREGVQQAAAMTASLANQDYVDEYKKKITLKNGGKMKINNYEDRIARSKKYKCGGRKKSSFGSFISNSFKGDKLDSTISGAMSGISNLVGSIVSSPSVPKQIKQSDGFSFQSPKMGLTQNSYQLDNNNNLITNSNSNTVAKPTNPVYTDKMETARLGCRKKAKCGTKSKK